MDVFGWMPFDVSIQHQETKEATRGAHRTVHGCRRLTLARHACDPFAEVGALKPFNLLVTFFSPALQPGKIARIALQRVSREALLDLNVTQEFADQVALVYSLGHHDEGSISGIDFSL